MMKRHWKSDKPVECCTQCPDYAQIIKHYASWGQLVRYGPELVRHGCWREAEELRVLAGLPTGGIDPDCLLPDWVEPEPKPDRAPPRPWEEEFGLVRDAGGNEVGLYGPDVLKHIVACVNAAELPRPYVPYGPCPDCGASTCSTEAAAAWIRDGDERVCWTCGEKRLAELRKQIDQALHELTEGNPPSGHYYIRNCNAQDILCGTRWPDNEEPTDG